MLKYVLLAIFQCFLLAACQVFLKLGVTKITVLKFNGECIRDLMMNWQLALSGGCIFTASLIWVYILKHVGFSIAYPLISISYIFGMLASIFVFHETVPITRWVGVALIMVGIIFVTR